MKFSIWEHMNRLEDVELDQQYEDRLRILEQADRSGFYGYYLAEHHHTPLCMAPSQIPFLAAAAQRTSRLRLGAGIHIAPMYPPIRLLEEIGMLDRLSRGRAEVGISAGAGGGLEVALWGLDPSENREKFEETLDVLIQGLQGDFVTHVGKHYRFEGLWMAVKAMQRPNPPMWYGGSPGKAGALGLRCFATHRTIAELPKQRKLYFDAWRAAQSDPAPHVLKGQSPMFGTNRHVFIAPTDAEARERGKAAYASLGTRWDRPLPGGKMEKMAWDKLTHIPPADLPWLPDFQQALDMEKILVGSPSTVRDYVLRYAREGGSSDHFLTAFQFGDISHHEASRSLKLFAEEVAPAVLAEAA